MKKTFYSIFAILAAALLITSCSSDDEAGGTSSKVNLTTINWNITKSELSNQLKDLGLVKDGDDIFFADNAVTGCALSYEFSGDKLQGVALAGLSSSITENYLSNLTSGYTELGMLDDGSTAYVNESKNTIISINTIGDYITCSWTKLK